MTTQTHNPANMGPWQQAALVLLVGAIGIAVIVLS